jgi:hypothetical protein
MKLATPDPLAEDRFYRLLEADISTSLAPTDSATAL